MCSVYTLTACHALSICILNRCDDVQYTRAYMQVRGELYTANNFYVCMRLLVIASKILGVVVYIVELI